MNVGLIHHPAGLSEYAAEMLRAWGLGSPRRVHPTEAGALEPREVPVLIVPAQAPAGAAAIGAYAQRGGTVIAMLPDAETARLAGLTRGEALAMPRRLRLSGLPAGGFAGESPPLVGAAVAYTPAESVRTVAHQFESQRFEGETPAITIGSLGSGRIISFAFDLPRCVLLLRQGDPALAEQPPAGDRCARPSHMAARTGLHDAGWTPYADLLARLLVDLVAAHLGSPLPLLDHLPGGAPGLVLYSGDEDDAPLDSVNDQLDYLSQHGARMDLNVIPLATQSTRSDVERYRRHHDVNPHPDLRPLDGHPVAERQAELERQIRLFEELFGGKALALRTHGTAWCGYMEHVESLERCGVLMESGYFSGSFFRERDAAPYGSFGGAMPMRFCRPDGRLIGVLQQHTQIADDIHFAPEEGRYRATAYSYRIAPAVFDIVLERMCRDIVERFHTPLAACIHPGNWAAFSKPQGQALVREAGRFGMPVWSFTQWCRFWLRRDAWSIEEWTWQNGRLAFTAKGGEPDPDLRLVLPAGFQGGTVRRIRVNGREIRPQQARRYRQDVLLLPLAEPPPHRVEVEYGGGRP